MQSCKRSLDANAPEVLLQTVQRLSMTGLVVEDVGSVDVTYTLTHPLIQKVAYDELPEMARDKPMLPSLPHSNDCVLITSTILPAIINPPVRQVDHTSSSAVLLAAGERTYSLYANDQAAMHFGAALGLIREGCSIELLPSVLERLGEARKRVGETAAAIAVWNEASILYERVRNAPRPRSWSVTWHWRSGTAVTSITHRRILRMAYVCWKGANRRRSWPICFTCE